MELSIVRNIDLVKALNEIKFLNLYMWRRYVYCHETSKKVLKIPEI